MGEALRGRVREETGVTCSVGIAPNRMLAKVSHFVSPSFGPTLTASCYLVTHPLDSAVAFPVNAKQACDGHRAAVPQGRPHALQVCADRNKPDGQFVLPATLDAVNHFVSELPIRKVPGIGKVLQSTDEVFQSSAIRAALFAVDSTCSAESCTVT